MSDDLLRLLATYRQTLTHLVAQAAAYGGEPFAPPQVAAGIAQARGEIERLKASLRQAGHQVEDEALDQPGENGPTPGVHAAGGSNISINIGNGSSVGGGVIANTGTMTTLTQGAAVPMVTLEHTIQELRQAQSIARQHGDPDLADDMETAVAALEAAHKAQAEGKSVRHNAKLNEARNALQRLAPSNTLRSIIAMINALSGHR